MKPRSALEEKVIEGLLVPVRWDAGGEVSRVSLMTFDEAEYRIDRAVAEAHKLRDLLRKHIRVLARIRGRCVIEVKNLEVFETRQSPPGPNPHGGEDW